MEQWKQIIINGEEWNYEVSNLDGKVRNTKTGRILKQSKNNKGYCIVCLHKNGMQKGFSVHRLVALMFIPNSNPEKTQVNHIDENKNNNSASNLEWVTPMENMHHGTRTQRIADAKKGKPLSEEAKRKLSEKLKGKYTGKNNPFYGKHHTEETKQKISETKKAKKDNNS